MITSRSDRKTLDIDLTAKGKEHIAPGSYIKSDYSMLRPLQPQVKRVQQQPTQIPNCIEAAIANKQGIPPVGRYEIKEPVYVRRDNMPSFQFMSTTERQLFNPSSTPGPAEYNVGDDVGARAQQPIKPIIIREIPVDEEKTSSIPVQVKERPPRCTDLPSWANVELFANPGCQDYAPEIKVEADSRKAKKEEHIIPATGGSSLTRYDHQSRWALQGEREVCIPLKQSSLGPGSYGLKRKIEPEKKQQSALFQSQAQRFGFQKSLNPQAAQLLGAYNIPGDTDQKVNRQQQRLDEVQNLQQQMQQQQVQNRLLAPGLGPQEVYQEQKADLPDYIMAQAALDTPVVGAYNISTSVEKRLTKNRENFVEVRPPAHRNTNPPAAPSIPQLTREIVVREMVKSQQEVKKQPFEQQPDRFQQEEADAAMDAQYNVAKSKEFLQQKVESVKGTGTFASGCERDMFAFVKKIERDIVRQEQRRRRQVDLAQDKRQAGGQESVINFTASRVVAQPQLAFGKNLKETTYSLNVETPGPGLYDIASPIAAKDIKLYNYDRGIDGTHLPQVLKENIGPGAKNALRVLAERRAMEVLICPQTYQTQESSVLKRSYNALSSDNRLD